MMLVSQDPWRSLARLQRDVSRLFERADGEATTSAATSDWIPPVDIREEHDRYVLHVDVPGVDPGAIEVTAENGVLTVRGERPGVADDGRAPYKRVERVHGSFYRRFTLPDAVDTDQIQATCQLGVLEISIPKQAQVQPRRINVAS